MIGPSGDALSQSGDGRGVLCIGGLPVARVSSDELCAIMARDVVAARAGRLAVPRIVTSANGSVVARYHQDRQFRDLIDACDLIDADGMPLVLASRLFCRNPLQERVATTDWLIAAAQTAATQGIRFFFIGSRPGVAQRAAAHLASRIPDLQMVGTRHGYFEPADIPAICAAIREVRADVVWVGMGSPWQESFAVAARSQLPGVAWIRTCGGLFDHFGGGVSRAPAWMQAWGLEWLYRAAREPIRLGLRYIFTNPVAVYHLLTKTRDAP